LTAALSNSRTATSLAIICIFSTTEMIFPFRYAALARSPFLHQRVKVNFSFCHQSAQVRIVILFVHEESLLLFV
jgi:hypothetical protein